MITCWKCGRKTDIAQRVGFRERCAQCDQALHSCRNCTFYDPAYNNQCRETMADRVVDKERANFCEYFQPASSCARSVPNPPSAARAKLEGLFKKRP